MTCTKWANMMGSSILEQRNLDDQHFFADGAQSFITLPMSDKMVRKEEK